MAICADDFGMTNKISKAINTLVHQKRLNAVSCMMIFDKGEEFEKLQSKKDEIQVGLHLTLTDFKALTKRELPSFFSWYRRSIFSEKMLYKNYDWIMLELEAQYIAFEKTFRFSPSYIDYHHHLQLMPFFMQLALKFNLPVRSTNCVIQKNEKVRDKIKKIELKKNSTSSEEIVILSDDNNEDEAIKYLNNIANKKEKHLLLHPGHLDDEIIKMDSLLWQRERDFNLLTNDHFFKDSLEEFLVRAIG
jgi:predicted glycoside hydrolase/deacetylase ChbG (UPF0249 family)